MVAKTGRITKRTPPPPEYGEKMYCTVFSPNGVVAGITDEKTVASWTVPGWEKA